MADDLSTALCCYSKQIGPDEVDLRTEDGQTLHDISMRSSIQLLQDVKKLWPYIRPTHAWSPVSVFFSSSFPSNVLDSYATKITKVLPQVTIKVDPQSEHVIAAQSEAERVRLDDIAETSKTEGVKLGDGNYEHPDTKQFMSLYLDEEGQVKPDSPRIIRRTWKLHK